MEWSADVLGCSGARAIPKPTANGRRKWSALAPAIIVAFGSSAVAALLQATRSVPVVFVGAVDPVSARLCCEPGAAGWQRYWLFVV